MKGMNRMNVQKKCFLKVLIFVFLLFTFVGVTKEAEAAANFKNIVGKYTFDTDLYYFKNGTSPVSDFGSEFSAFTPYLKITEKKKIIYYFSFEGGEGTCSLKGNTLSTKINNPNSGIVKEKMKVETIGGTTYLVQKMSGKKIYWKKKTGSAGAAKSIMWYGTSLDSSTKDQSGIESGATYKGKITAKSMTLYGSVDEVASMSGLWNFDKCKMLASKKRTYTLSSECGYFTYGESGKIKIDKKEFQTMFNNCLKKNSSGAGVMLLFKVSGEKIVDMGFAS